MPIHLECLVSPLQSKQSNVIDSSNPAFCLVVYSLSTLILTYYHPGGVKHAISVISTHLETKSEDLEIEKVAFINEEKNQNVTIRVNNLSLSVSDHSLLKNNSSGGKGSFILARLDKYANSQFDQKFYPMLLLLFQEESLPLWAHPVLENRV